MTDRYNALTVIFKQNIRADDAGDLISIIKMLKGVLTVEVNVADIDYYVAEERAKAHLQEKIAKVLWSEHFPDPK